MLLSAAACAPEPTPLPAILPTLPPPTTISLTATPAPLRYAVAPDALPFLSAADRAAISASAAIVELTAPPNPADLGVQYDVIVTTGSLPDATAAPSEFQVSLLLDTTLAPLDDPQLAAALRRAIDPAAIARALGIPSAPADATPPQTTAALRTDLANAGYPDGFDVTLAANGLPGADSIVQMLAAVGIEARSVAGSPAHLTLTSAAPPADASTLLLYRLPLYFRAVDSLSITFTPSGFPVAQSGA